LIESSHCRPKDDGGLADGFFAMQADSFRQLKERLTSAFYESERRGEEMMGRLGKRVSDSMTRLQRTSERIQILLATWRHGESAEERDQ
jgi:hypothetical protein